MLSLIRITAIVAVVILQASIIQSICATKAKTIDEIVNGTFKEINRLINNAGHLIKVSLENDLKETVKLAKTIGVAGDYDHFQLRAEELDRFFVGRVNHILDRTNLLLDRLICKTEQTSEDKIRSGKSLTHVEVTLDIMHNIVWRTEDFVSDVTYKAKPKFFEIQRKSCDEARKVHNEALQKGSDRETAQQKFEEALRRGSDQAVELVNKSAKKILNEIKKATRELRFNSKVLLDAGHEAEGRKPK